MRQFPSENRITSHKVANSRISALKSTKFKFLQHTLPSMLITDPKKFWRVVRPTKDNSICLVDCSGCVVPDAECPHVLNDIFNRNFVAPFDFYCPEKPPLTIHQWIPLRLIQPALLK